MEGPLFVRATVGCVMTYFLIGGDLYIYIYIVNDLLLLFCGCHEVG